MLTSEELMHTFVCAELGATFSKKNKDYGGSFHNGFLEYGLLMSVIRLEDKLNRLKTLAKSGEDSASVKDESIRDTLMDLANYAIMTVMELDSKTHLEEGSN